MEGSPRETDFLSGRKSRGSLSRSGRFRDVRRSLSGDPRHLSGINVRKQFSSMVVKKKLKNSRPNIDHVFSKDYVVKFGSVRDWSFRSSELSNQGSVIHEVDESSEAECEKKDIIPNDLEYMEPNDAVDINALVQSRSIMLNENLHEEKTNASWINSMRNLDEIHSSMNHSVDSELPSSIQNLVLKAKNIVCNLISRESYLLSDDGTNQLQILSEILNCILPEKNKQLNNPDRIDLEQLVSSKEIKNNASEVIQDENLKLSSKTIKFEKFKIDVYRNSESVNSLDKSASLLPYRASSSRSGSITSYKRTSIESDGSSPKRSSINNIFRLSRTHIINSLDSSCTDVCIPEETERSTQPSGPRLVRSFSDSSILDLEFCNQAFIPHLLTF